MKYGVNVSRPAFPASGGDGSVEQWFGGTGTEISYNADRFYPLARQATSSAINSIPDTRVEDEMEYAGTIESIAVTLDNDANGPDGTTFVLYKNGVATAHVFELGEGEIQKEIAVNLSFVEGDKLCMFCDNYGEDAASGNAQFVSVVRYSS